MLKAEDQGVPPQEEEKIKSASIPTADVKEQVVYYNIVVRGSFNEWAVAKRYSQFEEMHNMLLAEFAHTTLPKGVSLPPKKMKMFVSHVTEAFIEERRVLLENYLKKLIPHKELAKSKTFVTFMTSDKRAKMNTAETKEVEMPEDVEVTKVLIPSTRTMSDHVLYQIDVVNERKRKSFSKWTVLKRYTQFFEMDTAVREDFAEEIDFLATLPVFPGKQAKLLTDHMDPTFIEERRALLEHYLQRMIKIEKVVRNQTFLVFLGVNV